MEGVAEERHARNLTTNRPMRFRAHFALPKTKLDSHMPDEAKHVHEADLFG